MAKKAVKRKIPTKILEVLEAMPKMDSGRSERGEKKAPDGGRTAKNRFSQSEVAMLTHAALQAGKKTYTAWMKDLALEEFARMRREGLLDEEVIAWAKGLTVESELAARGIL